MNERPLLEVRNVNKTFRTDSGDLDVLRGLDFEVRAHEVICILGPSGAGKTTLLRCLSGLERPTSGEILLEGERIESQPGRLAFVFQDYSRSLLPWMSVLDNVMFTLRGQHLSTSEAGERARSALLDVGLRGFEDSHCWELSGGMQQRVAIARALAYDAPILVMDEPFAAVDAQTRSDLQDLLLAVHERLRPAVLFVTHDVDEAVYLADRVAVLSKRPARVQDTFDVQMPKPRDQIATKAAAEFTRLRTEVLALIKGA